MNTYEEEALEVRHSRPRIGKTNRDRMGEAHKRNAQNKEARRQWHRDCDHTFGGQQYHVPFPSEACNGKRNRHRVTIGDTVKLASDGRRKHRRNYAG